MTWRLARSLEQLRREINAAYPGRSIVSDGALGDSSHSARVSDHNPDGHGVVHAIDVTQWDPGTPANMSDDVAENLAEYLRTTHDGRVKYVIWRGRMFASYGTASRAAWTWGPYRGPNGHFHHVHVSVKDTGADDVRPWGFTRPGGARPDPNDGRPYRPFRLTTPRTTDGAIYAKGGRNNEVAELQILLRLPVDGIYGPRSADAVRAIKALGKWRTADGKKGDLTDIVDERFANAVRALGAMK